MIPLCYDKADPPLWRGSYADLWKGRYYGRDVAAKTLRVHKASNLDRTKKAGYPQLVACINELTISYIGTLQGNRHVEIPSSSERAATVGCDSDWVSVRDSIGVDE